LEKNRSLIIEGGRITEITGDADTLGKTPDLAFSFEGRTAFPGLINIHDHLVGTWYPKAGEGIFKNVYEWLAYYEKHPVRLERMGIPDVEIVALGGYRNLVSGVTTVMDHYFRLPPATYDGSPIRVITEFGREWVLRSHTHPAQWKSWGEGIETELAEAKGKTPFVIHIGEGTDDEVAGELGTLRTLGGLGPETILVHCVSFTEADIDAVKEAGAHMVWCPASNHFLYGETMDVAQALEKGVNISLGTDSTVTGSIHLLREMAYARKAYLERHSADIPPRRIVEMVTSNPARALGLKDQIGSIEKGKAADIVIVEDGGADPYETLLSVDPAGLDLVIHRGTPAYGLPRYRPLFEALTPSFTEVELWGQPRLVVGDPKALVRDIFDRLGYEKDLAFFPIAL
jgi:cytosine/adenosine deaminase-related metal-dependent hydrolase